MRIFAHTAEVCFTAIGDALAEGVKGYELPDGPGPARFRSLVNARSQGRTNDRQEVYYSFRYAGRWAPDEAGRREFFRRSPAMFKVQIQRQVAPGERRGSDGPSEQFLGVLLPEIERRLAESSGRRADRRRSSVDTGALAAAPDRHPETPSAVGPGPRVGVRPSGGL